MSAKPETLSSGIDESYCQFGIERLAKLLEGVEAQIAGVVKSEDIEYVHRMRVASRRLRATMPLFATCFPKKKFKRWLQEIKKVTKLLGEARDLDIQIQFIENYQSKNREAVEDSVAEHLLQSKKARRSRIQPNVVQGLEELQDSAILIRMREFLENITADYQNSVFDPDAVREKAYWAIAGRLDDFLAMEEYVYRENETLKLHEMRIRAKHLRYTMETFSPMYPNGLTEEIETMKSFQDSLGEMHDCDVWTEYIARSNARSKARVVTIRKDKAKDQRNQSQPVFLLYAKEQRKSHYTSFVELWETCKKNRFFEKLGETTNSGFLKVEDKVKELQANPEAEIAVLADIHANLHALQAVIEDAEKRGIRFFLNAGDAVGFGPYPNEAVELLHSKNVISVVGNFDREVLNKDQKAKKESKIALEFARKQVSSQCSSYLRSLPQYIKFEIAGKKLLLTHGSPESLDEHIYHDTPPERLKKIADDTKADVVITGHSHDQYAREADGAIFVNPGSVGRPGDGNPKAAYAILKVNPFKVELIRIDYDVSAAADALRKRGLPESFSQMLLRGVAINTIVDEDRQRKKAIARNCRKVVQNCEEVSYRYWQDIEHYEQVRKLSLLLFDELKSLHKLSRAERCWLECASTLHDIGISKTAKAHNKKSMKLILNDTSLILPSTERRIIASIARYHRKGCPKKKHYNVKALGQKYMHKISLLSGILRVADSLDYTHGAIVKNLRINVSPKVITVECTTSSDPTLEQQAFNKKKDLIEKTLNKRMMLTWKQLQR